MLLNFWDWPNRRSTGDGSSNPKLSLGLRSTIELLVCRARVDLVEVDIGVPAIGETLEDDTLRRGDLKERTELFG